VIKYKFQTIETSIEATDKGFKVGSGRRRLLSHDVFGKSTFQMDSLDSIGEEDTKALIDLI